MDAQEFQQAMAPQPDLMDQYMAIYRVELAELFGDEEAASDAYAQMMEMRDE